MWCGDPVRQVSPHHRSDVGRRGRFGEQYSSEAKKEQFMTERSMVIDALNGLITIEMSAINQYFVHAKICESRGLARVAHKLRESSMEEMRDVETLMDRVLLLGGLPNLQRIDAFQVGENVIEMFELHAGLERGAVDQLKAAITTCANDGDVGSEQLLRGMVAEEEAQLDWLTTQLELIEQLGESTYLAQQLYE
jgi:bacterioferritin